MGAKLLSVGHEILWPAPLTRWPSYIKGYTPQARVLIYCTQTHPPNKRCGEQPKDSSCHFLCVCAHTLLWRQSFQVAAGMLISKSLCVYTKDIWHYQPAQLSALTFSKDKERAREWKGDAFEMEQNTNDTFRQQQHTHRAQELAEQRGLWVCVASLHSFIPARMKAHSKQSYHHHTSAKMKKHSQPFSLLYSQVIPQVSFHMSLLAVIHLVTAFSKCRKKVYKCYHFPTQREFPSCFS